MSINRVPSLEILAAAAAKRAKDFPIKKNDLTEAGQEQIEIYNKCVSAADPVFEAAKSYNIPWIMFFRNRAPNQIKMDSAVGTGKIAEMRRLYRLDSSLIDSRDKDGKTLMHKAPVSMYENRSGAYMIEELYRLNPNLIDSRDKDGKTVMHSAVLARDLGAVISISELAPNLISMKDNDGRSINLLAEVHCNHPEFVEFVKNLYSTNKAKANKAKQVVKKLAILAVGSLIVMKLVKRG